MKSRQKKAGKPQDFGHFTRPELMRQMLQLIASWFPDRHFLFVADSLYTGESVLRHLPANVDMIGAVHPKGALYEPAPPKKPGRGVAPKKGKRLATRERWAANSSPWQSIEFDQFGLHATLEVKTRHGLYYKAGHVPLQPHLPLVFTTRTPAPAVPRPSLVSGQVRTKLCGYAHDTASHLLGRAIPHSAATTYTLVKSGGTTHVSRYPRRIAEP